MKREGNERKRRKGKEGKERMEKAKSEEKGRRKVRGTDWKEREK